MTNIQSFGVDFMWTNNRKGRDAMFERIDCAMTNAQWLDSFKSTALCVFPITRSDYSPLLLDTHWVIRDGRRKRPKRFEEIWLHIDEVGQITKHVWELSIRGFSSFQSGSKAKVFDEASF